jgi:predicted enzyme related to lactoylglutathione lyase
MAIFADPTGSVLALWEAGDHPGAAVWHEPGSVIWNELATHDPARAEAFYTELFGWEAKTLDFGPAIRYTEFHLGDAPVAGMYGIQPGMEGMPAVWMPYFGTADPDEAAPRAAELGAEIVQGPADVPGVGRFVLLRDPQGALFYAMRLDAWSRS